MRQPIGAQPAQTNLVFVIVDMMQAIVPFWAINQQDKTTIIQIRKM